MAESEENTLNPSVDLQGLLSEAQNRWLYPSEVCEILCNYQEFQLTSHPPSKPPSGSLFLFDRNKVRHFCKDGHNWRKKNRKTVREVHEKLKVREETVVTLVKLGVAPSALEDPTTKFPQGQTPADLASSRGHKGIAGYLAEADLTSQFSSLALEESVMSSVSASLAVDKAIETAKEQSIIPLDRDNVHQLSFRASVAALRTSVQATAQIQAAFCHDSFRQSHSNLAHVRGHQVRKQYKKVVWSVGIVEKAMLRWRRKRTGLRGFWANGGIRNDGMEMENADECDFLHIGCKQKIAGVENALARVYSMVDSQEACQQYMKLSANAEGSKMGYDGNTSCKTSEDNNADENIHSSFAD